ncbi:MAG TPA: exosortase H [Opitutaceae bacterium]|nr:exosortase H [Opitutaceae bacterium]
MKAGPQKKKSHQAPEGAAARARSWLVAKGPVLNFGLKFGALMALFYAVSLVPFFDRLLYVYLAANARLSGAILNWFGQASHVSEVTIRSARFAISVRRGCDAIEPAWFFCAAVLSFPAPWARKIPGLLAGAALILVMNLARIVSLFLIGVYSPRFFSVAHLEIWPVLFILAAILFWAIWIKWSRRHEPMQEHAAA